MGTSLRLDSSDYLTAFSSNHVVGACQEGGATGYSHNKQPPIGHHRKILLKKGTMPDTILPYHSHRVTASLAQTARWPANILADSGIVDDKFVEGSGDANANSANGDDSAHRLGQHVPPSSSSSSKTLFSPYDYTFLLLSLNACSLCICH
ncbi:unnamed protein product [Taenia asiatica]|uniref:Uncharacterized protein n=1 Tax=Taenia asiatica TaxID=60517 RepID=A0A0R3VYD5_TAEAS|nr:unnamed protein product [Taenia asiatica]